MVFSSLSFIFCIFPIFLVCDLILKKWLVLRNAFLIVISLIFYTWGGGRTVIILLIYGLLNYAFGLLLYKNRNKNRNQQFFLLIVFCSINVLALVYYKYLYWFVELLANNISSLSFLTGAVKHRELPLGISFFTFHALSFLIDLYKNKIIKFSAISFLTYFFMFPHLVAGPIVRYASIEYDLNHRMINKDLYYYGLYRFIIGLNKKILIANLVAPVADTAFSLNSNFFNTTDAWLGAIAYTLQIYFDFSAYSDMAIGLAAMAGFKFDENFNRPYLSMSIKDFWRRWHMSLSSWLRDYVYIPLGGSRVSPSKTYLNLVIVFFICGLWHGANLTFICWGLYHGFLLILERLGLDKVLLKLPSLFVRFYVLFAVMIGWVVFRADNLDKALFYLSKMFDFTSVDASNIQLELFTLIAMLLGIAIVLNPLKISFVGNAKEHNINSVLYLINTIALPLSIILLFLGARNPFIYFNF